MGKLTLKHKLFYVIPVIISIFMVSLFKVFYEQAKENIINDRYESIKQEIVEECERITRFAERDEDFLSYHAGYLEELQWATERIDSLNYVFCALYDSQTKELLTIRHKDDIDSIEEFNLYNNSDFIKSINTYRNGEVIIPYNSSTDIKVYYEYIPNFKSPIDVYNNEWLLVGGVLISYEPEMWDYTKFFLLYVLSTIGIIFYSWYATSALIEK